MLPVATSSISRVQSLSSPKDKRLSYTNDCRLQSVVLTTEMVHRLHAAEKVGHTELILVAPHAQCHP